MVLLSTWMERVANSTPMVDLDSRLNSLRVNRESRLDLPTPESPIRTTRGIFRDEEKYDHCQIRRLGGINMCMREKNREKTVHLGDGGGDLSCPLWTLKSELAPAPSPSKHQPSIRFQLFSKCTPSQPAFCKAKKKRCTTYP